MKKTDYIDKEEAALAKSLETEDWVSDLSKKEKKQYEERGSPINPAPGELVVSLDKART